jgi:hypothetical protein
MPQESTKHQAPSLKETSSLKLRAPKKLQAPSAKTQKREIDSRADSQQPKRSQRSVLNKGKAFALELVWGLRLEVRGFFEA